MYRLIAFDLDDTLLLPSGELSTRASDAVRALHQRGVQIVLASGRMLANILPHAETLGISPALVSFNGAQVNLDADSPPLFHQPVPAALAARIIHLARERDLHLNFYYDNRLYATRTDNWQARAYREQTGAIIEPAHDMNRFIGLEPTKLIIIEEAPVVEALMAELGTLFHGQLTVTRSKPIYLELLHPAVQKGAGFESLCRALGIPLCETAAFGDGYNDIEMLQAAGISVAVENAMPEVKAVADRVCGSNAQDGVAEVLEEWLTNMPIPTEPAPSQAAR